jgi:hypothetical protein
MPSMAWRQELTGLVLKTMWSPESEGKIKNWNQVDKSFPDMPLALYGAGTAMDPSSSCAARRWNLGRKSTEHCFARTARAPDQADRPTRCASEACHCCQYTSHLVSRSPPRPVDACQRSEQRTRQRLGRATVRVQNRPCRAPERTAPALLVPSRSTPRTRLDSRSTTTQWTACAVRCFGGRAAVADLLRLTG